MPNEYISLSNRLQQIQQSRKRKFSEMMKPVINRLDQIKQLKEKEEKEGQQLSAIQKIYEPDVKKYGLDLEEYSREEFGTPSNYERYISSRVESAAPEYKERLTESKEIGQMKRDIIDAYGEEALEEMDINKQSTLADWDREYKQYKQRIQNKKDKGERIRKLRKQFVTELGKEAWFKNRDATEEELELMIAQSKYKGEEGEGKKTTSRIALKTAQEQKLADLTNKYDVEPKEDYETQFEIDFAKLSTLKYLEFLDNFRSTGEIPEKIDRFIRDKTGREKGDIPPNEVIKTIKKELAKYIKTENLPEGGMPQLTREEERIFGMQRKNSLGDKFKNTETKKTKKDTSKAESWKDYQ